MLTCWHLSLSTMQVPMPSAVTLQVQQSDGQRMVWHGSGTHVLVIDTQAMPAPHWVAGHLSVSHLPVCGLQNCLSPHGTVAQESAWQLPAMQRSLAAHFPGTHRSLHAPSSQYWPAGQLTLRHLSFWHLPATQIWGAVQASDGSLQSRQRAVVPLATQILGCWQTMVAHRSTQRPLLSSHF